jgi:hypothetical protein
MQILVCANFAFRSRSKPTCLYKHGLYTLELNFGQTVWDKTEVLFGTLGEQLGNLDNPMGNTLRTREKTIQLPQKKKKNLTPHEVHAEPSQ